MTGIADFIYKDDDAQLLRSILRRTGKLERATANDVPVGSLITYPAQLRASSWSKSRTEAVGTKWSRWYRLNDLNESGIYEDEGGAEADRAVITGAGTNPLMGQPGGMSSEGSYSIGFSAAKSLQFPAESTGARAWTMEAIFRPDVVPVNAVVFSNGNGGSGQGILINNGAGGSGSKLVLSLDGLGYYDTGVTLVAKDWYHAVFVSDDADNTVKWYLGRFNTSTRQFSYTSGSVAVAAAVPAVGLGLIGATLTGLVDEALVYNGKLTALEAEDRIRCAMMPGAPGGFLPADGGEVARAEYPKLFERYGIFNGAGDGTTTFNLPNYPGMIVKY